MSKFLAQKDLSEAHKPVYETKTTLALSIQVCTARIHNFDQTARKAKIHNRCSKQDTYHVTNKNIGSSKIPMVVGTKRGCHSGASPSLDA
jgi:hypothetical protein